MATRSGNPPARQGPVVQQGTVATQPAAQRLTPEQQKLVRINTRLERGSYRDALAKVLPRITTPERFVMTVLQAVHKIPALLECTEESLAQSALTIATWGLDIGRTAHIVPYGSEATALVDWKGMVELAIRGRSITSCRSRIVYANDPEFRVEFGLQERVVHVPAWQGDAGEAVGVYAVVRFPSGDQLFDIMSKADCERIRDTYSKAYTKRPAGKRGPWESEPLEMWKKTVVRRLLKQVPQNPLLAQVLAIDEGDREATADEVMRGVFGQGRAQVHPRDGVDGYGEVGSGQRNMLTDGLQAGAAASGEPAQPESYGGQRTIDPTNATQCVHEVPLTTACTECEADWLSVD